MMELPNYSSQLMQQLWSLRKEGHFCDCTILVGESPHRAHKLVLAASSMLFRSLLNDSDIISIDTAVVSSMEFGCLLDMVYTGKLPLGKHNVSRIVAAADNLQMFDVAVAFKNVLTSLVNQQPAVPDLSTPRSYLNMVHKAQSMSPEHPASTDKDNSSLEKIGLKAELKDEDSLGDSNKAKELPSKQACVELIEASGHKEAKSSDTAEDKNEMDVSWESPPGLQGRSSQLVELLTNISSVLELLSQEAQASLEEQERQVVCHCCEDADPRSALEKIMSMVNEGQLSNGVLLRLLWAVHRKASSHFPPSLVSLMEKEWDQEEETRTLEPNKDQTNAKEEHRVSESEQQCCAESEEIKERLEEEYKDVAEENESDDKDTEDKAEDSSSSLSKPFSCRWCKKGFLYKCRMLAHLKRCSKSQEREHQCPLCPSKLANVRALQRHRAEAHRDTKRIKKKIACDICGRTFAHPSGMIYHKRTEHFEEKPFACDDCGVKFGAKSSLKNHMRLHTGEKPYLCKHCDMSFSVAAALAYHTKKKHSEGKMYVCQYCKAIFAQSIELTRHVRTHTGDRPYVCRECGKGYSQASGLTVHLQTFHNLSEPHDCQKCCLSFTSLEEHLQHIQESHPKDFHKCPTCSKVFTSAVLLEKHKGTHTGAKPFNCDLCNKSYQQLSGLWYHNRTNHPDVFASHNPNLKTLVQCQYCFKFFPSVASVAKHQASEHQAVSGEPVEEHEHVSSQHISQSGHVFSCALCAVVSASQLELQDHLLSCHMESQEQEARQQNASTSLTVISSNPTDKESVISVEQAQLAAAQQVLVALAGGEGASSAEVVEVNMYDLLNSSVTFICEDKPS